MGGGGNLPIGPGIWGFIAFFVLAIALWLLVRNMNARLRRMAYRDRDESAAAQAGTPADADGRSGDRAEPEGGPSQEEADGSGGEPGERPAPRAD
jgi:hypothetical protein